MFKKQRLYGLVGLILILTTFIFWYLPTNRSTMILSNLDFFLGYILFFDFISFEFSDFSLLHNPKHGRKLHLLIVGYIVGLFLELFFDWIGKFWYYPRANTTLYLIILTAFPLYFLYILESYLAVKAVLEHFFKKAKKVNFKGMKS